MSEWKDMLLGDVCDIYDGPHATPQKIDSGHIFLGISNINYDGKIDTNNLEYIGDSDFEKWTKRVTPTENDIVFSYETKLGTAAIIPKDFQCCLGRRMGLLRSKENISPKFLLYYYLSPEFQKVIYERTYSGSTVDRIPLKEMASFPIKIPNFKMQQAIASVLSALDDKIDLLQRQNQTLEQMAATLFRQWFIEEAKEDWEAVKIGTLFKSGSGKSIKRSEISDNCNIPVLGANGLIGYTETALFNEDLIYTGRVGTLGKVTAIKSKPVWLSDNTIFFKNISYFYFTYFHLKQIDFQDYNSGSTQPLIRQSDINNIEIQIPSNLKMLNNFEEIVSPYFEKIDSNTQQIQTLQTLRDTLLPKLISGEVRLKGFETVS